MLIFRTAIAVAMISTTFAYSIDAAATTYAEQEFTCPIGGEKFKSMVVGSNSTFGQRPDGRPYSPLPVYPLVECPGNGFLIFDDGLSKAELKTLKAAIATPEYVAMRENDTPYARLAWLKRKIGRGQGEIVDALLVASWETDDNPARKAQYQADFIDAADALDEQMDVRMRLLYAIRAANAARELSRFADARQQLDRVQPQVGELKQERERRFALEYIAGQRMLVAEGNTQSEPLNLLPPMVAAHYCKEKSRELSLVELARCSDDEVKELLAEYAEDEADEAEYEMSAEAIIGENAVESAAEAMAEAAEDAAEATEEKFDD